MNLPSDQQAARRPTLGPFLPEAGNGNQIQIAARVERLSPLEFNDIPAAQRTSPPEAASTSTGLPEPCSEIPDDDLDSNISLREAQQLLLWSAAPEALEVSLSAASAGEAEGSPPAAAAATAAAPAAAASSPSQALLHSLGDAGLRSAMRPPAYLPQQDWLRHLLVQTVEDAQLLFSSLWGECNCPSLGLPRSSCPDTRHQAGALDPIIAFAACSPGAPKRRLARNRGTSSSAVDNSNSPTFSASEGEEERNAAAKEKQAAEAEANSEAAEGQKEAPACEPERGKRPTAREYIAAAMAWAARQLEDPLLFPPSITTASGASRHAAHAEAAAKDTLRETAKLMVRRLLRCYAHVYLWHLPLLQQHGAVAHANRCLKRLMFLAVDAQLLEKDEQPLEPIRSLADAWLLRPAEEKEEKEGGEEEKRQTDLEAARDAAEHAPDDWLLPALEKAELCLGCIDSEEFPLFGTVYTHLTKYRSVHKMHASRPACKYACMRLRLQQEAAALTKEEKAESPQKQPPSAWLHPPCEGEQQEAASSVC
ncbi:hypothetical protein Efla_004693 [Eimeria flavescens]